MRCDECGRPMKNAELWQLAGDPRAPTSSSMRHLCWECRNKTTRTEQTEETPERDASASILGEAADIVRQYESTQA